VRLTQNIPNFRAAYGSDNAVNSLLGHHVTKLFHRDDDPETNEWASKLIAKETRYRHSVFTQRDSGNQLSVTEVEEASCPPSEFMTLKNGGKTNNMLVEAILFQSGRLWLGELRWARRQFAQ
jgi:hypothetical protein